MEALEDMGQLGWRNTNAGVAHGKLDATSGVAKPHIDTAGKGKFESVRQEIEDDLIPHVAADISCLRQWIAVYGEVEARPPAQSNRNSTASSRVNWARSISSR